MKKEKPMDAKEQIAFDLESAQERRYRAAKNKEVFFLDSIEDSIFVFIKKIRKESKTYNPMNLR